MAVTYTLNTIFGTGIVAGDTGILLNNEMDDARQARRAEHLRVDRRCGERGRAEETPHSMSPTIVRKRKTCW